MQTTNVQNLEQTIIAFKNGQAVENHAEMVGYAGFLFIKAMFDEARKSVPNADVQIVFNASDDNEAAILAIQVFKQVRFSGSSDVRTKIADMAEQYGCNLL